MSPTPSSAADSGLELEKLRDAVQRAEQAEKVQRALFAISHAADQDIPLPGMLEQVRSIISELMYADNFYVALHNRLSDSIDFLYMVDSVGGVPASGMSIPMAGFENSLTWHLVHHGKPLRGSMAAIARQLPGRVHPRGGSPEDWMGVPMLDQGEVRGVLVVQNYERSDCFTEADQNLLYFVGSHVLAALQRRRRREDLEQAVLERTADLDRTNHELKQEVQERQRGERLQRALYRIAELAGGAESMEDFCRAIHDIVGDLVGVDEVIAEVLPTEKAAVIERLQAEGRRVAMVGDGINDAAALASANLGLAVVSGTDVALKSADIILVRRNLNVIPDAIGLARRTLRTIRGNLLWAFGYNVAAIPLAAFGLLNPLIAGFAMSLSSVFVVTNSTRLRRFKPGS